MIELECPMCDDVVRVAMDATELRCDGCAVTVDLVDRFDRFEIALALAA